MMVRGVGEQLWPVKGTLVSTVMMSVENGLHGDDKRSLGLRGMRKTSEERERIVW